MFIKIEEEKKETLPDVSQYIVFKSADVRFAGVYLGDRKASPFTMSGQNAPVFVIEEWMPVRIWI